MPTPPSADERAAIEAVLAEYVHAIDTRDFDALDGVFLPNALIDYTAMGGIQAHYPEMKRWLAEVLPAFPGYYHLLGTSRIVRDGERAMQSRTPCFNPTRVRLADGSEQVMFLGLWYLDQWQHTPEGWRIAQRVEEKCFDHNVPQALKAMVDGAQ